MKAMCATKLHFGVQVNLTSSAKWLCNQMYCAALSFKPLVCLRTVFYKKPSHSLAFFQATNAKAGAKCLISPAWPLSLAGWDHGFSWLVNMETTRLLNFSLMPRSLYASLSKAQTSAVFFDPSCFLAPRRKAQAWRTDPAILAVIPKSKVCSASKHTLYSGKSPGIVRSVCLVQGLSFKPSKDFSAHPGCYNRTAGKIV